jgi:hypothetical protein
MGELILIAVAVFLTIAFLGFCWTEGLWGNTITLFNISFATMFAINYWEMLAKLLAGFVPQGLLFWDFVAAWLVFLLSFFLLKLITNRISRVKLLFPGLVENLGNLVVLILISVSLNMFLFFTLHLAPMPPKFCLDGFKPEMRKKGSVEATLLALTKHRSTGPLSNFGEPNEFDPQQKFIDKHAARRAVVYQAAKSKNMLKERKPPFVD